MKLTWIKAFALFALLGSFFFSGFIANGMLFFSKRRERLLSRLTHYFSRMIIRVLGITVDVKWHGLSEIRKGTNYLIAFNHLSYLDVLIVASVVPVCFVTSVEIQRTPFLGWLCWAGGCLFVERRSWAHIGDEVSDITRVLTSGTSVAFCPEATSSNGESVLPFKKSLMAAASHSGKPVLPICLNYKEIDGEQIHKGNRDFVFWYGKMSFFPHLMNLLSLGSVSASLDILSEIRGVSDHRMIADTAFARISKHYVGIK